MNLSWMLPVLHPSLPLATQLEAGLTKKAEQLKAWLGKGSSFKLRWDACSTYKSDSKRYKKLITWRVVSERYNKTKIVAELQKSKKDSRYILNTKVFDHMKTDGIEVRING